jgi:hypothetical protein
MLRQHFQRCLMINANQLEVRHQARANPTARKVGHLLGDLLLSLTFGSSDKISLPAIQVEGVGMLFGQRGLHGWNGRMAKISALQARLAV